MSLEGRMRQAGKQWRVKASLVAALLVSMGSVVTANEPEPAGYRMENYRAPVPATLQGAKVVSTAEAEALWKEKKAVFFDVMPHTPKPADLPEGTIWREQGRRNIPGSLWLANTGYGALPEEVADHFAAALRDQTAQDKARAILFYCMTDCWMSWNAAKRALELGYTSVLWYPHGADGWERAGLPLEEGKPYLTGKGG